MKILIAEDDVIIRMVLTQFLIRKEHEVISARDGEDAIKLFHESPHSFDVLITDIMMPNMNGIELAKRVKEKYPELPIIAITAGNLEKIKDLEFLFEASFNKPLTLESLYQTILGLTLRS